MKTYNDFVFVSELYKEDISEDFGRVYAMAQAAEDGTLIGVDENAGADQVDELVRRVKGKRVGFSLYLEGPGGPTGDQGEYQADELLRIVRRANRYGEAEITDPREDGFLREGRLSARVEDYEGYTTEMLDQLPWMIEWNREGWVRYFRRESLPLLRGEMAFLGGKTTAFAAVEIDNLDRHLKASGKNFETFLKDFESWIREGRGDSGLDVRLVLKNLHYDDDGLAKLEGLANYARSHGTELFVGFHIAEVQDEDFPERQDLEVILRPLEIRTVLSTNTHDYLASTLPRLSALLRDSQRLRELEISVANTL